MAVATALAASVVLSIAGQACSPPASTTTHADSGTWPPPLTTCEACITQPQHVFIWCAGTQSCQEYPSSCGGKRTHGYFAGNYDAIGQYPTAACQIDCALFGEVLMDNHGVRLNTNACCSSSPPDSTASGTVCARSNPGEACVTDDGCTAPWPSVSKCVSGRCTGMSIDGGATDGGLTDGGNPADSGNATCNPPCLSGQTCAKASPIATSPSCQGDQCQHTSCPSVQCSGGMGTYTLSGCQGYTPLEYGASCVPSVTGHDPNAEKCMTIGPNTMHCDFPEGSVDCPALWIYTGSRAPAGYTAGCCGAQGGTAPYCGIGASTGPAQPNVCSPLSPGNGWAPAP